MHYHIVPAERQSSCDMQLYNSASWADHNEMPLVTSPVTFVLDSSAHNILCILFKMNDMIMQLMIGQLGL